MKTFNDKMYGFYYMLICKKNEEARNFLNKIEFDPDPVTWKLNLKLTTVSENSL